MSSTVDSSRPPSPLSPRTLALLAEKDARIAEQDAYIEQLRSYIKRDERNFSLIFSAIAEQDDLFAADCLGHPGELNARNEDGFSPLTYAVFFRDKEIVHMILGRGVSPNQADDKQRTALSVACSNCDLRMVKFLLSMGAHVSESPSLLDALFSQSDFGESTQIQILDALVGSGLSIDPAQLMSKMVKTRRSFDMIKRYIPNPNIIDNDYYVEHELVQKLFAYVDCDELVAFFEPLHDKLPQWFGTSFLVAAKIDSIQTHAHLVKTVDITQAIIQISSLPITAQIREKLVFLIGLLKEEPYFSMYGSSGKCPITRAIQRNDMELANLLRDKGFKPTPELCREVCKRSTDKFPWIFDATKPRGRADLYRQLFGVMGEGSQFDTMYAYAVAHGAKEDPQFSRELNIGLQVACRKNNVAHVKKLLGLGADPTSRYPFGQDAMEISEEMNRSEVIRALLAHGAQPTLE